MTDRYLHLKEHATTGVALSDTLMRYVQFREHDEMALPKHAGTLVVPEGVLDNGRILNKSKFITFLKLFRKVHGVHSVNLVLTSSQVQTFSISAKGAAPLYIREAVEKLFGLPFRDVVYEYHSIGATEHATTFQVTTVLKAVVDEFVRSFLAAGIKVTSIESIGHALTRAIVPADEQKAAMVVDIDRDITVVTIMVNGKVAQTTMFAFGDDSFTESLTTTLGISAEQAERIKHGEGIISESKDVFDALTTDCASLVHHINEEYVTWHKAHKSMHTLEHVYISGAGSHLRGLDEYISIGLRIPTTNANVWNNCLSFDEYVPPLSQYEAVEYGAAVGVALESTDMVHLLPSSNQKKVHRHHIVGRALKILMVFILGVAVGFAFDKIIAVPSVHDPLFALLHKIQARW